MRTIAMIRMVLSCAILGGTLASIPARARAQGGCASAPSYATSLRQMSTSPQCTGWLPGTTVDATHGLLVIKYAACGGGTLLAIVRGDSYVTLPAHGSGGTACVDALEIAREGASSMREVMRVHAGQPFAAHLFFELASAPEFRCERGCPAPPTVEQRQARLDAEVQKFVAEAGDLAQFIPPPPSPPPPPPPDATDLWSFEAKSAVGYYLRVVDQQARIAPVTDADGAQMATFRLVPGLAGRCVSFVSVNASNFYLRHTNFRLVMNQIDGSQLFNEDATFCPYEGLAGEGFSFQSVNFPDRFLRQRNLEIWLDVGEDTPQFRQDATFLRRAPLGVRP